jgi:micrococcal nuclease
MVIERPNHLRPGVVCFIFLALLLVISSCSSLSGSAPGGEDHEGGADRFGSHGPVVTVSRVVDGDTVEIDQSVDGLTDVRLIGVDTPETSHPTYGEQPYGQQAKEFTVSRLEGERVALDFDVEKTDRYGRLLAYVWLPDGSMFNETLVREGYAQVATFPPNVKS